MEERNDYMNLIDKLMNKPIKLEVIRDKNGDINRLEVNTNEGAYLIKVGMNDELQITARFPFDSAFGDMLLRPISNKQININIEA